MKKEDNEILLEKQSSEKKPFIEPELKSFDELEKQTQGYNLWSGFKAQAISQFSP